ncbi:MAG: UDP-N-acetylmuramoyl-L-alanine--D-glutamate ligase [Spirochaetaceae bacterium]|jgi:UDP-N-acetylmuramoylalanine--D-glutamate ligase|nr:UDP-N-acetylmuramoyl-L-alanine--D-glutamate ligase [Spirochaetaceae bacterium]
MPGKTDFAGMRVTVMGLGLHGGGLESARYLAGKGAAVTVTDLRDDTVLAPSIEKLEAFGLPFRFVLGRHEDADFSGADMVIKNPGVRPDEPHLALARRVETDISLFLAANPARLIAVTGSKGKSGTASALHYTLSAGRSAGLLPARAFLGGNITVSPLSFLDDLQPDDDVVLELSSWQLGDLRGREADGGGLLKPRAALITAILPDHLDRYGSMDAYVADKRLIYHGQDRNDVTVAFTGAWGRLFLAETAGRPLPASDAPLADGAAGGWLEDETGFARLRAGGPAAAVVPREILIPGKKQKQNLLAAALVLMDLGLPADFIAKSLGGFPGIEHRLEFFHEAGGVKFYNDTAATIPESAASAIEAFSAPLVLVTGGADKKLDFSVLARKAAEAFAEKRLAPPVLLAGTGSEKLKTLLAREGVPWRGPFGDLDAAVRAAIDSAKSGGAVILSPGAASFGMFLNEFDRGRRWKEAVKRLT